MADGHRFENFKPVYLRNCLGYCNEILYGDAWRHLHPTNSRKLYIFFWKFKMSDGRYFKIFKSPYTWNRLTYRNNILRS